MTVIIAGHSIAVRTLDLPYRVKAVTLPGCDGCFDVYVNSALPLEDQRRALRHELEHIRGGHFYSCGPVAEDEQAANEAAV